MKQLFTLLSILVVSSSLLSAQETIEQPYYWQTWIFTNDSARIDARLPVGLPDSDENSFNNTQWRGLGQVVSLPLIYDWFNTVYNGNGNYVPVLQSGDMTEEEYMKQFQGAQSFTIDTIYTWIYSLDKNALSNSETLGSYFSVLKSDYDFTSTKYLSSGYKQSFADARGEGDKNVLSEAEGYMEPSFMAGQVDNEGRVKLTVFTFDPGELTFSKDESAILLFWNPLDPAYTFAEVDDRVNNKGLDDQRNAIFAQTEFRTGGISQTGDTRKDSLTYYKALGLVLYRDGNGFDRTGDSETDTLYSGWQNLIYGGRRSLIDMKAMIVGTVEIGASGVRFHFGRDVAEQGLGNVTPNPVQDDARLPFALKERAHVTIELFSVSGEKVATILEDEAYIQGNYSVPLPVSTLENGTYMVRMTAGENAYSMKFTVAK